MRIPIGIAVSAILFLTTACQNPTMTPAEFGVLIHNKGCASAEEAVTRQSDPDLFLGIMYGTGLCRTLNSTMSHDHFLISAQRGNGEAMYELFIEIATKNSSNHPLTQKEWDLARYWLIKAGEKNNWRAASVLEACYAKGCGGLTPIDLDKSKYYKAVYEKYHPN